MQTKRTYQQAVIDVVYPDVNLPARTEAENINGALPEKIYVNTLTQVSSFGFDFCLQDGRIYHKKSKENEWSLMPPEGLPFSETDESFIHPEKIVEIAADADCLYAFSNAGVLYRYYFRKIKTELVRTWIMNFGWPLPSVLKQNILVSDKRGWGMAVRREDILWYEDIYGNQHHYGTMGLETLYFLSADGRSIHFTDSGLPADFSHLIQGPEDGRFVAENISVSGSTIFLINENGEMYTRLIDFDTMGCDPMFFKYTYEKQEQSYKGSDYRSNFTPWALPAEPWKKQPDIPISGYARLSKFIAILQNGQGNAARELRVAGLARDGGTGYYIKQIDDDEWRFAYAPLDIPEDAYLAPESGAANKQEAGRSTVENALNFSYTGYVIKDGIRIQNIRCAVADFSLASEGKTRLRLSYGEGGAENAVDFTLHFVEAWTYLRRISPGFDGSPRQFFVTPEFDPDSLAVENGVFADILQKMFGGKNKQLFSCYLEATTEYFQLLIKEKKEAFQLFLTSDTIPAVNPEIVKGSMLYTTNIVSAFENDSLVLPKQEEGFSSEDVPVIREKIEKNQAVVDFLQEEIDVYKFFQRNSSRSRWGYTILDLFTTITFLNKIDFPKIKTLTMFGSDIVKINSQNFRQMADLREWIYSHFIELAQARVACYTTLLDEIVAQERRCFLDAHVFNTFPEYFTAIDIPEVSTGRLFPLDCDAELYIANEMAFFPGFFLVFKINGEDIVFLIELENSLEKIFSLPVTGNLPDALAESPFRTKAHILLLTTVDNVETYNAFKDFLDTAVQFEWDGKSVKLRKDAVFSAGEVLFEGFRSDGAGGLRSTPSVSGQEDQAQ